MGAGSGIAALSAGALPPAGLRDGGPSRPDPLGDEALGWDLRGDEPPALDSPEVELPEPDPLEGVLLDGSPKGSSTGSESNKSNSSSSSPSSPRNSSPKVDGTSGVTPGAVLELRASVGTGIARAITGSRILEVSITEDSNETVFIFPTYKL